MTRSIRHRKLQALRTYLGTRINLAETDEEGLLREVDTVSEVQGKRMAPSAWVDSPWWWFRETKAMEEVAGWMRQVLARLGISTQDGAGPSNFGIEGRLMVDFRWGIIGLGGRVRLLPIMLHRDTTHMLSVAVAPEQMFLLLEPANRAPGAGGEHYRTIDELVFGNKNFSGTFTGGIQAIYEAVQDDVDRELREMEKGDAPVAPT